MAENNLTIVINGNVNGLNASIQSAEKHLTNFEQTTYKVTKNIKQSFKEAAADAAVIGTAFQSVSSIINKCIINPLSGAVNGFVAFGDEISKTSQRIGMGIESLGALKFAAEQCGADFTILTEGVKAFQNQLGSAQMGNVEAIGKLAKVGLKADDFAGLSSEKQLMKLADYIQKIGDKAEQTRVAMELFGQSGFKLLPFFQEGSDGIQRLMKEGKDVGAVLGEDAVNGAVNLCDAMNRLKTSSQKISMQLMGSLAPALTSILDTGTSICAAIGGFYQSHKNVINALAVGVGTITAFVTAAGYLNTLVPILSIKISTLSAAFGALNTMLIANPIGLAITGAVVLGAALATLGAYFTVTTGQSQKLDKEVVKAMEDIDQSIADLDETIDDGKKKLEGMNTESEKLQETISRLSELNDKESLNNKEKREQAEIIDELNQKYPQLGIEIDKNTGKIKNFNQAMAKAIQTQADIRISEIKKEKAEMVSKAEDFEQKKQSLLGEGGKIEEFGTYEYTGGSNTLIGRTVRNLQDLAANGASNEELLKIAEGSGDANIIATVKAYIAADQGKNDAWARWLELNNEGTQIVTETNAQKRAIYQNTLDTNQDTIDAFDEKKRIAEMSTTEKNLYELNKEYEKQKKALEENRDMFKNMAELNYDGKYKEYLTKEKEMEDKLAELETWKTQQEERILGENQEGVEEFVDSLPEVGEVYEPFEKKDARIVAAEAAVQTARDKQATAILNNEGVQEADQELEAAQQALAQTIADVSGENRVKAKEELDAAQKAYDEASKIFTDKATLEPLAKAVTEAQEKYNRENEAYFNAVGSMRKEKEEEIEEVMQTTFSTSGTFSAYGMDAAVAYNDIPQQMLDVLRSMYGELGGINENTKEIGAFG